ncbi:MAG: DNA-binding response OmpR family regulator [bacterium]|jgi:DNA-binding response OmpR family regulator
MITENLRKSILLIEDEQEIADIMMLHLSDLNYSVTHTSDGITGLALALKEQWDLILLDLTLPRIDGIDICRQVRESNPALPIILVSARSAENERIYGLEVGADDYITKPFGIDELIARVKAVLRRVEAMQSVVSTDVVCVNGVVLDPVRRTVSISGKSVRLTVREFELLLHFAKAPGHVFNRGELLEKVWGYGHHGYLHTVNTHINRLRNKIELDPAHPVYIQTVWGIGYKFAV